MTEEDDDFPEKRRELSRLAERMLDRRKENPEGEYDPVLDDEREANIPVECEDGFTDPTKCSEDDCETELTDLGEDERMRGTDESGQGNYCPEHFQEAVEERGETPRYPGSEGEE